MKQEKLSPKEDNVLTALENGAQVIVDIAFRCQLTHGETQQVLAQLCNKGLVKRIKRKDQTGSSSKPMGNYVKYETT